MKKIYISLLLSISALMPILSGCNNQTPSDTDPVSPVDPIDPTDPGDGGGEIPPSGPTKVEVAKHTLSDGNPPININSIGQHVSESTWNSFKGAAKTKFTNHYNFTYRYYVGGQTTYERFTKNGYKLTNSQDSYYYEKINNKLYYYQYGSSGYERVNSSYDFISRRSEVLAQEVYVHMFEYDNYTYFGEEDGGDGEFVYNTSAFTSVIKFQGGYLTYLRYTLNSPITTYEIQLSFETTIDIPKSFYYE